MNNLEISLKKEVYESDFYHNLLKEEFKKIVYNNDIKSKRLHIFSSYGYENEYEIEFGIYIINASEEEIVVNNLPLCLYEGDKNVYSEEIFINKSIESYSAIFREVRIKKENIKEEYNISNLSISIGEVNSIKKFPYINIEIDNLPKRSDYGNYKDIKKFLNNLSVMEENQLAIDIFRTGEIEEGFYIITLFRNSSNNPINIKSIPLTVMNDLDLLIYEGTFEVKDDSLYIEGNKGKLMVITIPRGEFPIFDGENLNNYKVIIK